MADNYERLSAQDASFLYAESPAAHMHIGTLAIFEDGGWTEDELCAHIESRLHLVPRFRKRLAWVPMGQGRPVWVDDEHFDIRLHIRSIGLPPPGDEAEALRLTAKIMSIPLDRRRPLWEMWTFQLPGGRRALVQKTHHCLIDGVSGVDLGTAILDFQKDPPKPASRPPVWAPEPAPDKQQLLMDSVVERLTQPRALLDTVRGWRERPKEFLDRAGEVMQGLVALGRATLDLAPRTSLTRQIGTHRRFAIVRCALSDIKTIKNAHECKVNDVVLAAVSGGLRRLLEARGELADGLILRAMVPVSVRDPSQRMTYGNQVSMMAADLPVGEPAPVERLLQVSAQMDGLKESKQAVGADFWVKLSEFAPATVLALASRAVAFQRMVNLTVTNVPGPQFPLYLLGGKLIEVFPYVPLVGTTSLGVAIVSYDGQLNFGLSGDWDLVPDLDVLADGIRASIAELLPAVAT